MHARSIRSATSRLLDTFRLEWQIGLQRLPFFTQRLAVALLGLLVVSVALVGVMAVLWGGSQRSELPLRPPPQVGDPAGAPPDGAPGSPPPPAGGGGQVPASARATTSSGSRPGAGPAPGSSTTAGPQRRAAAPGTTSAGKDASSTSTTTSVPPDPGGDDRAPRLTVPPVLTTLLP
jgi:hypothetical protein